MKKTWNVLLVSLLLAAPAAVQAQFTYTINSDNTLTITSYSGSNAEVAIPATIDNMAVADIGTNAFAGTDVASITMSTNLVNIENYAFYDCSGLTNVTISDDVTNIGNFAFDLCTSLVSVTIPASVTDLGLAAFQNCINLTNVTFANGITSIGDDAFSFCSKLVSVTIPGTVTNVGDNMFQDCTSLTTVAIVNGVPSISVGMFQDCQSLRSVTIPGTVTNIGAYAFSGTILNVVTIPNSVLSVGDGAFSDTHLTSVTISSNLTSLGLAVFALCPRLANITVAAQNSFYSSVNGVLFDKSQGTLIAYPASLGGTGAYTIPASVNNVAEDAFAVCTLTNITIPASVTNIGPSAFLACPNLAALFFEGNAPVTDPSAFESDNNAVIYYLPGATGWSSPFAGLPAVLAEIITWANPAPIIYGTALSSNQLNATSDVPGSFAYLPTNGSVLSAGTNTLSAIFTPSNTLYYGTVTNNVSLVVSPETLTVTANNASKTYGQTLAFAGTEFTTSGLVNGDTVTNVTLASSGAAASAAVTGSPYAIVPSAALPASLANNYILIYQNGQLTVNPAQAAIASGITVNNKIYDGTTTATLSSNNVVLTGVIAGDAVSLNTNGYVANFASASVGSGIAVTVSGLTLSGVSAGNYTLAQPVGLVANIYISPSLQIHASKPNIVISWTTNATDYVLRQTASLASPVRWSSVTNSITVNGTSNTVVINASGGVKFFELIGAH
jgi:hypothetical protein